ncbi:Oidioi.mRNA.OKI2018_I69.chr1.g1071.t1.cds [Oikopleura dioica]|uniref:Oidioi.mRNA.OKI2018_I69.chr1.g1071.t1.cds n=1 Tax=Oikopleura dioica TaxID=34765 RepID=A0ABN7SQJ8_OIKDI|nr:Oidioi.mRNA.OKI2018_I69.chr1.g1071.t1.cds [Oikopleura dioica]
MKTSIFFAAAASAGSSGVWSSPDRRAYRYEFSQAVGPDEVLVINIQDFDIKSDFNCRYNYFSINGDKYCNTSFESAYADDSGSEYTTMQTSTVGWTTATAASLNLSEFDTIYVTEDLHAKISVDGIYKSRGFVINYEVVDLCSLNAYDHDVVAKQKRNC